MPRNQIKKLKKNFTDKKELQQTSNEFLCESQEPTTSHHSRQQSSLEEQSEDSNLYISNSVSQRQSQRHHSSFRPILPLEPINPKLHASQQIPAHPSTASSSTFIPVHEAVASSSKQTSDLQPLDLTFTQKPDQQSIASFSSDSSDETCEEVDEEDEEAKFVAKVIQRRNELSLTQTDLANKINEMRDIKCTQLIISDFELGRLSERKKSQLYPLLERWILESDLTVLENINTDSPYKFYGNRCHLKTLVIQKLKKALEENPSIRKDVVKLEEQANSVNMEIKDLKKWLRNKKYSDRKNSE